MPPQDAEAFAEAWRGAQNLRVRPYADEMDDVLHRERLDGRAKRTHRRAMDALTDGAFIAVDGAAFAIKGDALLRWTPEGYAGLKPRPRGVTVDVLTPPAILAVMSAGYRPRWHESAERQPSK